MGRIIRWAAIPGTLFALCAASGFGQSVISARSGLVHYVEGQVTLDGKTVEIKYSQFPEVRNDQVLKTEEGRAEVLLTPGVFLRLAENSSFRMLSNKLTDTRVEALSGSLIIEHGEITKDNEVTLLFKDRTVKFLKSGLYRVDADSSTLRVYQGEARVVTPEQSIVAKQGHEIQLEAAAMTAMKFDPKIDDEFYRWASRRAGYLAMANVSAAKSLADSGYSNYAMTSGMWSFNPWFGMFTYIPFNGMYNSPFGYSFYNPYMVGMFYSPRYGGYYSSPGYYAGGGGSTTSRSARYDSTAHYTIPSRSASTSPAAMHTGGARSFGGASMGASNPGMSSGGAGASMAGPSSRGGGASAAPSGGGRSGGGSTGRGR